MKSIFSFLAIILYIPCIGQNILYPELRGDDLLVKLVEDFKPENVLKYNEARVYMFENLQSAPDTVEGIYSGYKVHLPNSGFNSPIGYLADRDINTEHIYPRSKGAAEENGNAFSDLHHLAPSNAQVNFARLNHPFMEVNDERTTRWFRDDIELFDIPIEDIDVYSEVYEFATSSGFILGDFEPRESVKGNIARAVFYFYTMYREEADQADRDYFRFMRSDLCDWHIADPITSDDIRISELIGDVQENKANPFILDCSLALRTYCDDLTLICENLTVANEEVDGNPEFLIYPNPNVGQLHFKVDSRNILKIDVVNAQGQLMSEQITGDIKEGTIDLQVPNGLYIIRIHESTGDLYTKTIIVQK